MKVKGIPGLMAWGKTFALRKFRSMYVNNHESSHKEYVRKFITQGKGLPLRRGGRGGRSCTR